MKVLLIEDEAELSKSIRNYLETEEFVCETAFDFESALEKAELYDYDCILVDITLPNGNGIDVIRGLKKRRSSAGIIIISAKNSLDDKVAGLEAGSDDYMTKPFHLPELNARIKALMRRKKFDGNEEVVLNEIRIDTASRLVYVHDSAISLTTKEFDLLLFLVMNRNKVLSKNSIAEHLWGDHADQKDSFNFIYAHVKNLRKKMIEKNCRDYIRTVYSIGYNFNTAAEE